MPKRVWTQEEVAASEQISEEGDTQWERTKKRPRAVDGF
jgi:hypothetical protein